MSRELRQLFLPYCLILEPDGRYAVTNRHYKPVGMTGRKRGPPIRGPQPFLEQARFVLPGDFLRLEGTAGLFEVSHRVWHVMQDQVTLKLVLDGPVQDGH